MLSVFRTTDREASAKEVAARATDAAMRAADAAIRAADAAIEAANAAVRLIDEHDGQVIMLQPAPAPRRQEPPDTGLILPASTAAVAAAPASRRGRLALRVLAYALIALGGLALLDAAVTLVWQEPVSALYAKLRQDHLSSVLRREERTPPTPVEKLALASIADQHARVAFLARELQHRAGEGSPVARIRIPRIGVSAVVVKGTSSSDLRSGPGIYPETVFPGVPGTTAIAGHRTTYLAPFRHVDALRRGNRILLDAPYAHLTYTVTGKAVVRPTAVEAATRNVGYPRLVLSACTPLFSAAKRLLVYARLASTVPAGAAAVAPLATLRARAAARSRRSSPAVLKSRQRDLLSPRI
jgi:sortase A